MFFSTCIAKINGQRVLIFLDFLRLLAHMIPSWLPATHKGFQESQEAQEAQGDRSKVPVAVTVRRSAREGRGWDSHPICLIPTAMIPKVPTFPTWQGTSLTS